MIENEIKMILSGDSIQCNICNVSFSLLINRKDLLIGFKSHLKQKHGITIVDYFNISTDINCSFCKINKSNISITKYQNKEININVNELCNNDNCINERKKYNPNSAEWVSITKNISIDDALKIIHERNQSPFYRNNHQNEDDYLKSQRKFSPRCPEYYENKINSKTGNIYTFDEIDMEITIHQAKESNKGKNINPPQHKTSLDGFIKIYGHELGTEKYYSWKDNVKNAKPKTLFTICGLNWYKFVYGDKEGEMAYNHRQNYVKFINSSEYYQVIYDGDLAGDVRYSLKKPPNSSIMANDFFANVYKKIKPYLLDSVKIFFAALNNEKCITKDKKRYYYDFTLLDRENNNKKIIEFNGDFFHCNPKMYNENYINPFYQMRASDVWEKDKKKIAAAMHFNYDIKIIWESDIHENKDEMVDECVKFLIGDAK